MAIQDSNAERRNLTVLSMSIIVYYAAGGEFDGDVKLPLINLHFENKAVLAYFLWGILGWFLLRYWMVNKESWQDSHRHDLINAIPYRMIEVYLKFRFSSKVARNPNFERNSRYSITIDNDKKIQFIAKLATGQFSPSERIEPKGILDKLYLSILCLYLFVTRQTLSGYFTPYLLFIIAVCLGVSDWLKNGACLFFFSFDDRSL
ncbi:MAG: hypothetical protein ACKVJF_09800 [Flavobacteriales bacterium]